MADIVKVPSVADQYKPFHTEAPASAQFEEWELTKVTAAEDGSGWSVTGDGGMGVFVPNISPADRPLPAPKPGDRLRVYGRGLGSEVEGLALNGRVIFWHSERQLKARRAAWLARYEIEKQERFERERASLDARYDALPAPFKVRLDRFRAEDPRFRVDAEGYESFILQQAALLFEHFRTEEAISAWARLGSAEGGYDLEEQMRQAPEGWDDGHSGNTHGCAIAFARALARGETAF